MIFRTTLEILHDFGQQFSVTDLMLSVVSWYYLDVYAKMSKLNLCSCILNLMCYYQFGVSGSNINVFTCPSEFEFIEILSSVSRIKSV